jgi:predicted lysophospholipase L1 biosynthesis ABC-type transport system permease subunit
MLWTILAILVVLWLLGFIGGVGGNLIHLLLVIALQTAVPWDSRLPTRAIL